MITKKLSSVNKDYNEMVKNKLSEVYKDITGLDIEEFKKIVIEDIDTKEKEIKEYNDNLEEGKRAKVLDPWFRSDEYVNEKAEEAFQIALNAYKKENAIDITFEETYDSEGKDILLFGVTKLISKYTVDISLNTDLEVSEIKKFNLES